MIKIYMSTPGLKYTVNDIDNLLSQIQHNQPDGAYQIQIQNNYQQLIDTVTKENNMIDSTYSNGWILNSASGQQSRYVYQSSAILTGIYNYCFWIYLVIAIILCVVIIRKEFSIYAKIALCAGIILYPYYIYPLEEFCYMISVYIWSVLLSTTYDNGYGNTNIEYGLSGTAGALNPYGSAVIGEGQMPERAVIGGPDGPDGSDGSDDSDGPISNTTPMPTLLPGTNTSTISQVNVNYDQNQSTMISTSPPTSTPGPPPIYNMT